MSIQHKHNGTAVKVPPRYRIEVAAKYGQDDPHGAALSSQLASIGLPASLDVRVSSLYELIGTMTKHHIQTLSRDLLTDPITQEFRLDDTASSPAFLIGPHWRVEVWLKPTVTDPTGESVREAVGDLGLPRPEQVRTGTAYRILGNARRPQIDRLLNKLLSNPLIHETIVQEL
ncbi:MAG: phosphoribosylformylglycinamidine synthase subunit PurS [Elusimicrobiota bacterium]